MEGPLAVYGKYENVARPLVPLCQRRDCESARKEALAACSTYQLESLGTISALDMVSPSFIFVHAGQINNKHRPTRILSSKLAD